MNHAARESGFTLIEVIISVLLLSVIALALTSTLVSTQRALTQSKKWMIASQLAADGLERLRAGGQVPAEHLAGGFDRTAIRQPAGGAELDRLEVTVTWRDDAPHEVHLVTLARR